MRIISGNYRGRQLATVEGRDTRPTLDRVKEAIFSSIQFEIEGSICLDLFSGSGSMGIEAYSRGASKVIMCDNSVASMKAINYNVKRMEGGEMEIVQSDYMSALARFRDVKFDFVFLDPPYKSEYIDNAINYMIDMNMIAEGGIIIAEHDKNNRLEGLRSNVEVFKRKKYGMSYISYIKLV